MSRVLYISGSIGLGHVGRDIAIVRELRKLRPDVEVYWMAGEPAASVLRENGEKVLPESKDYCKDTSAIEDATQGMRLDYMKFIMGEVHSWEDSFKIFARVRQSMPFDLIVGDEAFDVAMTFLNEPDHPALLNPRPFIIFDFVTVWSSSLNPMNRFLIRKLNSNWEKAMRNVEAMPPDQRIPGIFLMDLEDIPDKRMGLFQSNMRKRLEPYSHFFMGDVLNFDPAQYQDQEAVRKRLGYGPEPLIICTVGGTKVGAPLLDLCARTYPHLKKDMPNLKMVLVAGPRIQVESIKVPEGVEVRGYVPKLHEHLAACDLAVVQCGGTTTNELVALNKPFIYFPLEGHAEQDAVVASKLRRHNAGVEMKYTRTSPEQLARVIRTNISTKTNYRPLNYGGEKRVAAFLADALPVKAG